MRNVMYIFYFEYKDVNGCILMMYNLLCMIVITERSFAIGFPNAWNSSFHVNVHFAYVSNF
jgi:hypothetical protein